jgi:hypothetical protein
MSDELRGTGRTYRMLRDAAARYAENYPVLVVVHSGEMIHYARHLARREGLQLHPHSFVTPAAAMNRMSGVDRDNIFIDHYVYELHSGETYNRTFAAFFRELALLQRHRPSAI